MPALPPDFYTEWSRQQSQRLDLQDKAFPEIPPERLLQHLWQNQQLRREDLRTLDGQKLTVLHPGFWNHEAGPDFRQALLQFDGGIPQQGDIEIDLHPSGWVSHGHQHNPNYANVILHVLWKSASPPDGRPPVLVLSDFLDAPWQNFQPNSAPQLDDRLKALQGKCAAPLGSLEGDTVTELLEQAALVRFRSKALQFATRAKSVGWEQSLWEGLFAALGYKQNSWPMRRLAEVLPRHRPDAVTSAQAWQARLFGISNFLEPRTRTKRSSVYLRELWEIWWREREQWLDSILPRNAWRYNSLRPINHPQRRLALAAHWLSDPDFARRLTAWVSEANPGPKAARALLTLLTPGPDPFWNSHFTLSSSPAKVASGLLGAERVSEVAVNVILPWLRARADAGHNAILTEKIIKLYLTWPASQDNSLLRAARNRLLGDLPKPAKRFATAAQQQGLLQILRDFCEHSNAVCDACIFPDLVKAARTTSFVSK